jgi:hypothetical protein
MAAWTFLFDFVMRNDSNRILVDLTKQTETKQNKQTETKQTEAKQTEAKQTEKTFNYKSSSDKSADAAAASEDVVVASAAAAAEEAAAIRFDFRLESITVSAARLFVATGFGWPTVASPVDATTIDRFNSSGTAANEPAAAAADDRATSKYGELLTADAVRTIPSLIAL